MSNFLINYADQKFKKCQRINSWTGKHIGKFDRIIEFSPKDISNEFWTTYQRILSIQRGNGLRL